MISISLPTRYFHREKQRSETLVPAAVWRALGSHRHRHPGESPVNVLCEGYRAFFTHIDTPMRIMADLLRRQKPPSEIMAMEGRFHENVE